MESSRLPMTLTDLAALDRLLAEATPGPWTADGCGVFADEYTIAGCGSGEILGAKTTANAALIAAAVNALPELIAAARERDAMQKDRDAELTAVEELMNTLREVRRERDALRAEVERMRAVVEAARLYVTDEPSADALVAGWRFDRIVDALDALDAASRY